MVNVPRIVISLILILSMFMIFFFSLLFCLQMTCVVDSFFVFSHQYYFLFSTSNRSPPSYLYLIDPDIVVPFLLCLGENVLLVLRYNLRDSEESNLDVNGESVTCNSSSNPIVCNSEASRQLVSCSSRFYDYLKSFPLHL